LKLIGMIETTDVGWRKPGRHPAWPDFRQQIGQDEIGQG